VGAVTVTLGASEQLILNWTAVAGADEYEVFQSTTNIMPGSATQTVSTTNATRSGLTNGTIYYFWVRAKNMNGNGGTNAVVSGIPMSTPGNLTVSAANQQITLNWTAVPGAISYQVFYSTSTTIPSSPSVSDITATNRAITGLTNGTTYYFWVKAVNANGVSGASSVASGKPIGNMGAVTVTLGASGQLILNWTAVAGADEYEVFQSTTNTMPGSTTQTVTTNTVTRSSLTNGTTYYFWVSAKNVNGNGAANTVVSGIPIGTPQAPTLISGFKQLRVSWASVPGASEYEVYYGTTSTPTTLATTITGTTTIITGLTNGTTYYVRIRAKNANGFSNYSGAISEAPGISPGLFHNGEKIGNQNLSSSLSYISSNAVSGDEFLVVLGADESIAPVTLGYSNRTVGITLIGYEQERTINLASNGNIFTVYSGVTLTLDENVTLVGRDNNTGSVIYCNSNSYLVMNNGSKISGNTGNYDSGGVFVYGTFTMNGGTINGNSSNAFGGGVRIDSGTFTMNGGTISGNTASFGGGVNVQSGTFTMNGGTISGNTAGYGGGVSVYRTFTMNGGTISGNTARNYGGGVYFNEGTFIKQGTQSGIIYGNDVVGNDENGIPLRNTASSDANGHAFYMSTTLKRNTTAGMSDQINTFTGQGLSANGNAPFGQ